MDGILKAVLRDEIIAWHKKTQEDTSMPLSPAGQPENMDSQQLVSLVQKAVTAIMTRLHNLAQFEGGESKVNTLVAAANSLDNLCRMDPAWHPWLWGSRREWEGWDDAGQNKDVTFTTRLTNTLFTVTPVNHGSGNQVETKALAVTPVVWTGLASSSAWTDESFYENLSFDLYLFL